MRQGLHQLRKHVEPGREKKRKREGKKKDSKREEGTRRKAKRTAGDTTGSRMSTKTGSNCIHRCCSPYIRRKRRGAARQKKGGEGRKGKTICSKRNKTADRNASKNGGNDSCDREGAGLKTRKTERKKFAAKNMVTSIAGTTARSQAISVTKK